MNKQQPNRTWSKEEIKHHINTNDTQLERALLLLYNRQTEDERTQQTTSHHNGIGFNGVDAPFLSSCAEGLKKHGRLTPKQIAPVRKAMQKYIGQLTEIANEKEIKQHAFS
jgi:hypothetical protein